MQIKVKKNKRTIRELRNPAMLRLLVSRRVSKITSAVTGWPLSFSARFKPALIWIIAAYIFVASSAVQAERIKDLVSISGVRDNQLIGYGLVVGLDGTGDSAEFTSQSLKSMLDRLGVTLPPNVSPKSKNVAAVAINATLGAFAKRGQKIDVTVSALGSAKSLRGGTLLMSPLKGADGQVYALAQGNVIVGGFSADGQSGSSITVGNPMVARIPAGATVERALKNPFSEGNSLQLSLHQPDFTTLDRLSNAINMAFGYGTAQAIDGGTLSVNVPQNVSQKVSFVSLLENLELQPADAAAKIIINARTGTVIIGQQVKVKTAAITHGTLTVTISENKTVSQPAPLSEGETVVTPESEVTVDTGEGNMILFDPGVELSDLVNAINRVGAAPDDLIAILQALREVGALQAELVVI